MIAYGFTHPVYLNLLLLVPLMIFFFYLFRSYNRRRAIPFANFDLVKRVSQKYGQTRSYLLLILRIVTLSLVIMVMAGAYIISDMTVTQEDFVFAIDTSSSMLATDLQPDRISYLKQNAIGMIDDIEDSSIGVMGFASYPQIKLLPDKDRKMVKNEIRNLRVSRNSATDLAQAIVAGSNMLLLSNRSRVLMLFTDGRHSTGTDLDRAIDYAVSNDIVIVTIGLGTQEGEVEGMKVTLGSDSKQLQQIANRTGGQYYQLEESVDVKAIQEDKIKRVKLGLEIYLLYAVLALLFFEFVLVKTIFKITP